MTNSVRLTCLTQIQTYLEAMATPTYDFAFSTVVLGPITSSQDRLRCAAGIVPGKETVEDKFPLTECFLPITIEFRVLWNVGDPNPQILGEVLLENIQRKMKEDIYLGGNAIDLRETGNDIVLSIYSDKTVEGYVTYQMLYRHATGDPRSPV